MTTRRERLEAKLQKRQDWADSASKRATARFDAAREIADGIPFGQPILRGHHSEKGHRRDLARIESNMGKGVMEYDKAQDHASKADGLAAQLDRNIYSDDPDAVEALEARIADLERQRDEQKAMNAAVRKGTAPPVLLESFAKLKAQAPWLRQPFDVSHLTANIARLRERITAIQRQQARNTAAEESGGVVIEGRGDYVRVTFAEKPDRSILQALRAAGFRWGQGSWAGRRDALPAELGQS